MPRDVSIYDHLRPTDPGEAAADEEATDHDAEPGVYRVVGTDPDGVTLLRVGDADGRRVNTGELLRIDRDALDDFETATNPDGNRSLGQSIVGQIDDAGWMVRAFARSLAARPFAAAALLAVLVAGSVGDRFVDAPDAAFSVAIVLGSLGLAYLGSRGG